MAADAHQLSSSDLTSTDDEGGGNPSYTITDLLDELDSDSELSAPSGEKSKNSIKEKVKTKWENPVHPAKHKGSKTKSSSDESDHDGSLHKAKQNILSEGGLHKVALRETKHSEVQKRVSSDISGRFYFEGKEYTESDEYLNQSAINSKGGKDSDDSDRDSKTKRNSKSVSFGSDDEVRVYDSDNGEPHYLELLPEEVDSFMQRTGNDTGNKTQKLKKDVDRPEKYDAEEKPKFVKVMPDLTASELAKLKTRADSTEQLGSSSASGSSHEASPAPGERRESIYEPYNAAPEPISPLPDDDDDDECSWGSSEFESFDEEEGEEGMGSRQSLRRSHSKEKVTSPTWDVKVVRRDSAEGVSQGVLDNLKVKLGVKMKREDEDEEDMTCMEVTLNMDKHPPPELGPAPKGLNAHQLKRRHIVASIVDSERSYTDSLRRIIEEYEKPLLQSKNQMLSKGSIKTVFFKVRDILQCHNMFHIELAELIRAWDKDECIGNVFTASFSKSIVFDVYSAFVNNFSMAMDTAKKISRQKQAFAEFLKQRLESAPDRLSLFGLMVKPVQRFPQFIMLLQDLLKSTPKEHQDRLALQMALTELENLTHKLNETKRESEYRHDASKIMSQLTGRYSIKASNRRYLIRQDDMVQLEYNGEDNKSKTRRLFMMSDQLICASIISRDHDPGSEKYKYKWSVPLRDVDIVENEVSSTYNIRGGPGKTTIIAPKLDKSTFTPWKKELDDMLHDLPLIEQVGQLITQLRLPYPNMNHSDFLSLTRRLQIDIQHHSDLDRSIIQLSVPTKFLLTSKEKLKEEMNKVKHIKQSTNKTGKTKERRSKGNARIMITLQAASPTVKQEWLLELKNAKLALAPANNPSWCVPETEAHFQYKVPLFIRSLLIDITRQDTVNRAEDMINQMRCAIPVMIPTSDPCIAIQHLWVCSTDAARGQVTIVSIHTNQPHVVESFQACDAAILCAEMVPGFATCADEYAFSQDTVWMATEKDELIVLPVTEESRGEPLLVIELDASICCLKYLDSRLYAGLTDGRFAIYGRDQDGIWNPAERCLVQLGDNPVQCLLPIGHEMWTACGGSLFGITVTTRYREGGVHLDVQRKCHELSTTDNIQCIAKAGVGLMVSFEGKSIIQIYCQESMQYLQDMNVASAIRKVLKDKSGYKAEQLSEISITILLASKGLLWIGTSAGCVLTLPLPRLEGVPQIKGRPNVSFHGHVGSVKFLVPIHCGVTQIRYAMSSVDSSSIAGGDGMSWVDTVSLRSRDDVLVPSGLTIEGATESETDDNRGFTQSDDISRIMGINSIDDYQLENGFSLNGLGNSLYGRNKWMSTPDLRQPSSFDERDDVCDLYSNLLEGNKYQDMDSELLEPRKKRRSHPVSPDFLPMLGNKSSQDGSKLKSPVPKYATLPVVMEDCPVYESYDKQQPEYRNPPPMAEEIPEERAFPESHNLSQTLETSFDENSRPADSGPSEPSSNPETTSTTSQESPISANNAPGPSTVPPQPSQTPTHSSPSHISSSHSVMSSSCHALNKAVIVVSGGDGHVNWSDSKAADLRYEDICLLLWQCRV